MKIPLKFWIYFTIAMTLALLMVMIGMIKENGKCVDDPFGYSAMRLNKSGGNYICSCKSLDPKLLDFTFNEDGIKILDSNDYGIIYNPVIYEDVDFSQIEFTNPLDN